MSHEQINQHLSNWTERESTAEAMIPLIGRLYRKNNVVTSVYGRAIINQSVIDIIRAHRFVRQVEDSELSVHDTLPILQAMDKLDLGRAHVDIGKLAVKFKEEGGDLTEFLKREIGPVVGQYAAQSEEDAHNDTKDVVLYGFGRIGRLLARILIEKAGVVTTCACARSLCARAVRRTISRSVRACFAAIPYTDRSMAPLPSMKKNQP